MSLECKRPCKALQVQLQITARRVVRRSLRKGEPRKRHAARGADRPHAFVHAQSARRRRLPSSCRPPRPAAHTAQSRAHPHRAAPCPSPTPKAPRPARRPAAPPSRATHYDRPGRKSSQTQPQKLPALERLHRRSLSRPGATFGIKGKQQPRTRHTLFAFKPPTRATTTPGTTPTPPAPPAARRAPPAFAPAAQSVAALPPAPS